MTEPTKNTPVPVLMDLPAGIVSTVVGLLCAARDLLGDCVAGPCEQPRDLVVVAQSGTYGPSASPHGLLERSAMSEVLA